jgi:NAD+ kinase
MDPRLTRNNGEPFSPAKIHPLLSPQSSNSFADVNSVDGTLSHTRPGDYSPQPPQTSVHCPKDAPYNASSVATTEIGGAPAASEPNPTISTSDESSRNPQSTELSASSSIENLTVLPQVPSFGENRIRKHRKNACSIDSAIPRQTILKALQSRPPAGSQSMNEVMMEGGKTQRSKSINQQRLAEALSELQLHSDDAAINKMAALASPCFFHKKFDKAVNLDKVLEEMADDDTISHSRLMQTATSVREVSKQLQRRPIKMTVRNVMIVTKARDNNLVYLTRELAEWLLTTARYGSDVGVNVYVDHKLRKSKRFDAPSLVAKDKRFEGMLRYWNPDLCWETPEIFDLVLTLGGDGTVLFTSWLFQRIVPPILSFALGSLGFLTNFQFEQYKAALNKIMTDVGMRVNLRMRFTCTVYRYQKNAAEGSPSHIEAEQFEVLNELVIDRGPSPYVSNLELYGDNNLLTVVQADGCIFSTPTGSTATRFQLVAPLYTPTFPPSCSHPSAHTPFPSVQCCSTTAWPFVSPYRSDRVLPLTAHSTARAVSNCVKATTLLLLHRNILSPPCCHNRPNGLIVSVARCDGTRAVRRRRRGMATRTATRRTKRKLLSTLTLTTMMSIAIRDTALRGRQSMEEGVRSARVLCYPSNNPTGFVGA